MNQRIEAWWSESRATTARWRQYFLELSDSGDYNPDLIAHRVAFHAVYMPILRTEFTEFISLWNNHRIRKQKDRPHAIAGIPSVLYNYPQADCEVATSGTQCGFQFDSRILEPLQQDLQGFDLDEFLPVTTLQWCEATLTLNGFTTPVDGRRVDESGYRVHCQAYRVLRTKVEEHMASQAEPELTETIRPYAARNWQPQVSETTQRAFEAANEDLINEEAYLDNYL